MPIVTFEDPMLSNGAPAPLASSSMTLFPVGIKKKHRQPRSISADTKPNKKVNTRMQESMSASVPQGILTSMSQGSLTCSTRLTLQPPSLHNSYPKWRLREPLNRRELSQGDGKGGLKDAIQKMNRLTLNGSSQGIKSDFLPHTQTTRERKNALKSHIVDLSNLFNNSKAKSQIGASKINQKKQQDLKNDIRKYFEEHGIAMSLLHGMSRVTALKFYKPSLPTIMEETEEDLARI